MNQFANQTQDDLGELQREIESNDAVLRSDVEGWLRANEVIIQGMIDRAVFAGGESDDVVYSICQVEYAVTVLTRGLWQMLDKMEGGELPTEGTGLYLRSAVVDADYWASNDAFRCKLVDGEWRLKTPADYENRVIGSGYVQ